MAERNFYPVTSLFLLKDSKDGFIIGILNNKRNKVKDVLTDKVYEVEGMPMYLFRHDFQSKKGQVVSRNIFAYKQAISVQDIEVLKGLLISEEQIAIERARQSAATARKSEEERKRYALSPEEKEF